VLAILKKPTHNPKVDVAISSEDEIKPSQNNDLIMTFLLV